MKQDSSLDFANGDGVVTAAELLRLKKDHPHIKILDATFAVQGGHISPFDAFLGQRIGGAQFFDIDAVADQAAPLPHTVPSQDYFAACIEAMGISNGDPVVVYDQSSAYMASSRAWWMFRLFGHENVCVLEGGLQGWIGEGGDIVSSVPEAPEKGQFKATLNPDLLVSTDELQKNLKTRTMLVIDARDASRFSGAAPEPRPGMRSGHIPGSANLPFLKTFNTTDGTLHSDIVKDFVKSQVGTSDKKLAITCGSGVTACTVALGLHKAGIKDVAIYDGSWSEWGDFDKNLPIEISA